MNRRDFLKILLATTAAATVDYEKLFWIKEKSIFVLAPEQIIPFTYNIAIPTTAFGPNYIGDSLWEEPAYKLINREQAIERKILIKGQGLEDIDNYMKHQIELSKVK